MKRLNYFIGAALAIAAAVSCEKDPEVVDFPIVGDFVLYGASAEDTWAENTSVGVFVTSDGVAQTNLEYTPASTETTGAVQLNAKNEKAGFKQGTHVIYAYYPYKAEVTSINEFPVEDYSFQTTTAETTDPYAGTEYAGMFLETIPYTDANPIYAASAEVKEFSSAPIELAFDAVATEYTFGTVSFQPNDNAILDRKLVKATISCDKVLAYKNATYDFATKKFTGEEVKSIDIEIDNIGFSKAYFISGCALKFISVLPMEEAYETVFTITLTLDDNSTYSTEYQAMKMTYEGETFYTWPGSEFSATPAE